MQEILVAEDDLWQDDLRALGFHLGRFIYLADAMIDFDRDQRRHNYNPFSVKEETRWDDILTMTLGSCTKHYEKLPLVQDKEILDNILYSGVWVQYRGKNRKEKQNNG